MVKQFAGGTSNPTFMLTTHVAGAPRRYVMRKKPPGAILSSAHAVEREYKVMKALGANATPMPTGEVYTGLKTGLIDGLLSRGPQRVSTTLDLDRRISQRCLRVFFPPQLKSVTRRGAVSVRLYDVL